MSAERKLAAILAADVAGYSRLAGADEERTLARLRALRSDLIDPTISVHHGRVVKRTGDGILIEFRSVVDAVRCAIEVQNGMVERNAGLPPDRRIEFRVGIHLGDVVEEEDGDLMGDGVNIAARLEGIGDPGGIFISEDAYRQVRDKIGEAFVDLGEQPLKNIVRPVRVYRIDVGKEGRQSATAITPSAPEKPALTLPDTPSIAVLPFANMSGDPEQEYFADGMVEDIITGLSRIRWLFVIARNSSFVYKGKSVDVKQVGRELGVRYVLEGSVRRGGNRVRITGQLIDAQSGTHLWADRYDGPLDDIFALQDEITLAVVGAIEPSLRQAEIERVKRKRPDDLGAYDRLLRAWPLLYSRMPEDATKAIPLFDEALALDPGYGLAHAALAWCYHARFYRGGRHEEDDVATVRHTRAAIAMGGDDSTALAIAAFCLSTAREPDHATALGLFDRALDISPSCTLALGYGGVTLCLCGKAELAIERAQKALRLSPFDPFKYAPYAALAVAYFLQGNFEDSLAAIRRAIESNPRFSSLYAWLASTLVQLGRIEEAKAAARHVLSLLPAYSITAVEGEYTAGGDRFASFFEGLRIAGLPE
jgi:adenylate cyclase